MNLLPRTIYTHRCKQLRNTTLADPQKINTSGTGIWNQVYFEHVYNAVSEENEKMRLLTEIVFFLVPRFEPMMSYIYAWK